MSHVSSHPNSTPVIGGRYQIINQLGAGGFGRTFLAHDLHLPGHPTCVVKQLRPQKKNERSLSMARRLFDTEARALYQLGSHSQIPFLFAHFEENEEFYLVQEFVEGTSLTHQFVKGKPWPEYRVIALLQDILQILAFVHQQQVIHRDIKPSNLIRRHSDGRIVLIDFGAVKQVSTQTAADDTNSTGGTDITISIGTQGYIPNEQLAGKPRYSSDVYAVGMVGVQAITGIHPQHVGEDGQTGELDWQKHAKDVSPELADVIDCMVRYDFRDRYPTAIEALQAVQRLPEVLDDLTLPVPDEIGNIPVLSGQATIPELASSDVEVWVPLSTDFGGAMDSTVQTNPVATSVYSPDATTSFLPIPPPSEPLESEPPTTETNGKMPTAVRTPSAQPSSRPRSIRSLLLTVIAAGITLTFMQLRSGWTLDESAIAGMGRMTRSASSRIKTPSLPPVEDWAIALLKRANRLQRSRQYETALTHYHQVISLDPELAEAYLGRCKALAALNKPAEAIVSCNDALAIHPDYAEAFWTKGQALEQQQQALEALRLFERAIRLKPSLTGAWIDMGATLQDVGRSVEAIQALDKAIALNRNSAEAWSIRGEALWNLGRYNPAIESLDKALQLQPNHPKAKALRQKARKQLGR